MKEAKVQINAGSSYGLNGAGHMRMNLAKDVRSAGQSNSR